MTLVPVTMNIVNWKQFIQVVKQEQEKDIAANVDKAGVPLNRPSSFITALGNLGGQPFNERFLHHLHYGFYFSMDEWMVVALSTHTDLNISQVDGYGIVSGTFLNWRDGIVSMLEECPLLSLAFFRFFEAAGLNKYFSKESKDAIRRAESVHALRKDR